MHILKAPNESQWASFNRLSSNCIADMDLWVYEDIFYVIGDTSPKLVLPLNLL